MLTWSRQRIGAVLKGWRSPAASLCLSLSMLGIASNAKADPLPTAVPPAEQSMRDNERLRILREELTKAESMAALLARRRAERLAASDLTGADEADQQRIRTLSDIEALKREIGTASQFQRPPNPAPSQSPQVARLATTTRKSPPTAWWDVYAKSRRSDADSPSSFAKPSASDGAREEMTRRVE
jgi:hypothetical protein